MTEQRLGDARPGLPTGGRATASATSQRWPLARDEGAVTAEYAVLLPAAVLVLVAVLLAGVAAVGQVRAQDAAASAARILARGDSEELVGQAVTRMAGEEARWEQSGDEAWVTVTVLRSGPGPFAAVELRGEATAPRQHAGTVPGGEPPAPEEAT